MNCFIILMPVYDVFMDIINIHVYERLNYCNLEYLILRNSQNTVVAKKFEV